MKIGIVDLDTSHPQNWIPILREYGHTVAGVWDGGSVHPRTYVDQFVQTHEVPKIFSSLEEMATEVDCAIIHSCDWDTHVDKARPFVKRGKSVLIDKPLAGNRHDLAQLQHWHMQGARIAGGSSLMFCAEVAAWLAQPADERGTPHTVFCGCGVDEFNYGIHAYSMLVSIMGGDVASVRHLGSGVQRRFEVRYCDGRSGFLVIGAAAKWLPFYATVVTEMGISHIDASSSTLYRSLLEATLPYLTGDIARPPVPFELLITPELCALAARVSMQEDNREVALDELNDASVSYNGAAFAAEYRRSKYPNPCSSPYDASLVPLPCR